MSTIFPTVRCNRNRTRALVPSNCQAFLIRFNAIILISALVLPMLVVVRSTRAEGITSAAPVAAPPEPFVVSSSTRAGDLLLSVSGYLSSVLETVRMPEVPAGLGAAKLPTFSERISKRGSFGRGGYRADDELSDRVDASSITACKRRRF